jgi:hypothetical protein
MTITNKGRTVSRKKFQEALRALKDACRNPNLSHAMKIRSAELICLIYGLTLPEGATRINKKAVKTLVEERSFEKSLHAGIRTAVQERVEQEAFEEAQATEDKRIAAALSFLREDANGQ